MFICLLSCIYSHTIHDKCDDFTVSILLIKRGSLRWYIFQFRNDLRISFFLCSQKDIVIRRILGKLQSSVNLPMPRMYSLNSPGNVGCIWPLGPRIINPASIAALKLSNACSIVVSPGPPSEM